MTDELTRRLHRSPTAEELASELDVPVTDIARPLVAVNAFQTRSLDTPARGTDGDSRMIIADVITVAPLWAQSSSDDQQLLIGRFYDTPPKARSRNASVSPR
ncbi:sigma-70 domain-containing protein [Nocardia salmonicida]|uniref:sigma-70 domain-containing protein n=1 Tax=Nocardia salmonicida TaxID=53431 RepID=UPI0034060BEA